MRAEVNSDTLQQAGPVRRPWTFGRVVGLVLKAVLPLAILAGAYASFDRLRASRPDVPRQAQVERSWAVTTMAASYSDYRPTLTVYGTLVAARSVDLRALVAGEVMGVHDSLRAGGRVMKGETLLELDPFVYEGAVVEAEANIAEAKARLVETEARIGLEQDTLIKAREQLEWVQRDLERALQLVERGTLSEKSVDDRRLLVSQREQAVNQIVNTLRIENARAEQQKAALVRLEWKLRQARRNLENVVLKAPFDSYISAASAEVGRMLGVNDVVATLYDRHRFDVRFTLSDGEFARLVEESGTIVGRRLHIRWNASGTPVSYRATVDRIAPEIESQRGGVDVFATVELGGGDLVIRPGAFVEVNIDDREYRNVVKIPATALYGGNLLYVVEDGRLAGRAVDIVGYDDSDILVSGELAAGERVVTTRITEAGDGLKVVERDGG